MKWYPGRTVVKLKGTHLPLREDGKTKLYCPVCEGTTLVTDRKTRKLRKCVACKDGKKGRRG